jgi:hypothetical protein
MTIQQMRIKIKQEIDDEKARKRIKVGKLLDLAIENCEQDGDRYTLELLEQLKEII